MTVFAHFPLDTKYFGEGAQQAMVNFRVDDLDALLAQLAEAGVRIDPKRDDAPLRQIRVDLGSRRQPRRALAAAVAGVIGERNPAPRSAVCKTRKTRPVTAASYMSYAVKPVSYARKTP